MFDEVLRIVDLESRRGDEKPHNSLNSPLFWVLGSEQIESPTFAYFGDAFRKMVWRFN